MKGKILLLFCLLLSLSSCTERYYDGSERYVVQGILLKEGQPLQHELVFIDTYLNDDMKSESDITSRGWYVVDEKTVVNTTYTDKNGFFRISFPGGNYTYILYTENYRKVLFNAKYTKANKLIDLGSLDIAKNKKDENKE